MDVKLTVYRFLSQNNKLLCTLSRTTTRSLLDTHGTEVQAMSEWLFLAGERDRLLAGPGGFMNFGR